MPKHMNQGLAWKIPSNKTDLNLTCTAALWLLLTPGLFTAQCSLPLVKHRSNTGCLAWMVIDLSSSETLYDNGQDNGKHSRCSWAWKSCYGSVPVLFHCLTHPTVATQEIQINPELHSKSLLSHTPQWEISDVTAWNNGVLSILPLLSLIFYSLSVWFFIDCFIGSSFVSKAALDHQGALGAPW